MKQSKEILKSYFETGDKPTEGQFSALIDSYHHIDSGVIVTNVTEDQEGNKTILLSDNTTITIKEPMEGSQQDNKIRVVDLGVVIVERGDESNIKNYLVNRINRLTPPLVVAENENIIIEFDIGYLER